MITLDKNYTTRDGRPVKVVSVTDARHGWPVTAIVNGEEEHFTDDGYFCRGGTNRNDLIEVSAEVVAHIERLAA